MKLEISASLLLAFLLLPSAFSADDAGLKPYASFNASPVPEIAASGVRLKTSGKTVFTEGRFGRVLHFSAKENPGDLHYKTGDALRGKEWTIAFWFMSDLPGNANYGKQGPGRGLFRTNQGWMDGNADAMFNNWGPFGFTHFSGDRKYCGASLGSGAFPTKSWIHLAIHIQKRKTRRVSQRKQSRLSEKQGYLRRAASDEYSPHVKI